MSALYCNSGCGSGFHSDEYSYACLIHSFLLTLSSRVLSYVSSILLLLVCAAVYIAVVIVFVVIIGNSGNKTTIALMQH